MQLSASDVANVAKAEVIAAYKRAVLLDLQADLLVQTTAVYHQVLLLERQVRVLENSVKVQEARVADMQARAGLGRSARWTYRRQRPRPRGRGPRCWRPGTAWPRRGRASRSWWASSARESAGRRFALPPVAPLESLQAQAAAHRQDLLASDALVSAADAGLQAAVAEYFPSVSVDFDYFLTRQSFPPDSHWLFSVSATCRSSPAAASTPTSAPPTPSCGRPTSTSR